MSDPLNQSQELELYDIYGLWHIPFWQQRWFLVLIALSVLLVCAAIAYLLYRRYKAHKPLVPAWQQALGKLQRLKTDAPLERQHSERYYVVLTGVLKEYMSARFGSDIRSLTDQQVCSHIGKQPLLDTHKDQLRAIFSAGELIKFAHQNAVEQQMSTDWQRACDFVMQTKNEPADKKPNF